jgi:hypothetical protein
MTKAKLKVGQRPGRPGKRAVTLYVPEELYNVVIGLALTSGRGDFSKQAIWMWREFLDGRGANPPVPIPAPKVAS